MFIICLFMTYFQTISEHSYCGIVLIRYSSEIVVKLCRGSRLHKFAYKIAHKMNANSHSLMSI